MGFIADFFDQFWAWIDQLGVLFDSILVQVGAWYVIGATKAKVWFIGISWQIASQLMSQLNISSAIQTYWGQMDSEILAYVSWFKIPEALNMVLNAGITRYVMDTIR